MPQQAKNEAVRARRAPGLWLAILAGLLLWLANPPMSLWPLAWIAIAPLIVSVTQTTHFRQAAWRGYLFGWAFLGPVWYWVGLTIVGWTGSPIGWAAWFGLTMILAGFYAVWGGAAWWIARRTSGGWQWVALAASWVVMEWARTLGALTMPWAQLSYTQVRFLPVLQIADTTGAYGVSFLMLLGNAALALWWQRRGQERATRWIWTAATLTVFVCLYGLARLTQVEIGTPLTVAALQGNFPVKQTPNDLPRLFATFDELTDAAYRATDPPPALYLWSESAAPEDALHDPATRSMLTALAGRVQAPVLVGSRLVDPQSHSEANASVLFRPDGDAPTHYDKQQLVPFGEFTPYRTFLSPLFDEHFHFANTDVRPGEGPTVLRFVDRRAREVVLGPFICYESMYPPYARAMTRAGANLLVTQSNDAWFLSQAAMEQHLAAVTLRAIENRRAVVRATTSGITCFLDTKGRVTARAPLNAPAFLVQTVHLTTGRTLAARWGDWFVALCGLLLIGACVFEKRRRPPAA